MKTRKKIIALLSMIILFAFLAPVAMANKTSVKITTVKTAKKGTEVTVTINVMHSANTPFHHTNWVTLKINGKEVKKWEYDKKSLPPSNDFTLTYTFVLTEPVTIEAQGHCNIHGSAGPDTTTISLE